MELKSVYSSRALRDPGLETIFKQFGELLYDFEEVMITSEELLPYSQVFMSSQGESEVASTEVSNLTDGESVEATESIVRIVTGVADLETEKSKEEARTEFKDAYAETNLIENINVVSEKSSESKTGVSDDLNADPIASSNDSEKVNNILTPAKEEEPKKLFYDVPPKSPVSRGIDLLTDLPPIKGRGETFTLE